MNSGNINDPVLDVEQILLDLDDDSLDTKSFLTKISNLSDSDITLLLNQKNIHKVFLRMFFIVGRDEAKVNGNQVLRDEAVKLLNRCNEKTLLYSSWVLSSIRDLPLSYYSGILQILLKYPWEKSSRSISLIVLKALSDFKQNSPDGEITEKVENISSLIRAFLE